MINTRNSLPTELGALLRLGADKNFRCIAIEERDQSTTAITGFTLWLCEHKRPQMDQIDYSVGSHRDKHKLTMVKLIDDGLSVWNLRRMQHDIKALSSDRMREGDKLQLTIWRGEPCSNPFGVACNNLLGVQSEHEAKHALVTDDEGTESLWVLWPISPDVRRTGL